MKDILREMFRLPWVRSISYGILVASFLVGSLSGINQAFAATGQDCDGNAVIYCGVSSVGDLQSKYTNGDGHNSGGNIQHIYNWFGISDSDMQNLGNTAKNGKVTDKGNVYVGDKMVASDAMTAGRQNISGSTQQTSQDTTFYTRDPSVSFASQSLDAYVVMKDGVFQFAVIKSCGNPVKATAKQQPAQPAPQTPAPTPAPTPNPAPAPPAPTNVCSGDTANTSTDSITSQGGNCSINTTTVVEQVQAPATQSETPPVTQTPSGQCDNLSIIAGSGSNSTPMSVQASVTYSAQNGAQLKSIMYDFGDGSVTPATTQTSMTHTYSQPGTYTIKATTLFSNGAMATTASSTSQSSVDTSSSQPANANLYSSSSVNATSSTSDITSVCQAAVTIAAAPTPAPPAPTPVTTTSSAPVKSVAAPQALVNTGPGSTIGLFIASTIGSSLLFHRYLRRHIG